MLTYIGAIFLDGIHVAAPYPSSSTGRVATRLRVTSSDPSLKGKFLFSTWADPGQIRASRGD